ncbi:MAG: hypothetical protein Q8K65_12135 [Alphaproteobacteria bacterium]|nr:hypothetical protein [Alphaproteobacteria bacterium]
MSKKGSGLQRGGTPQEHLGVRDAVAARWGAFLRGQYGTRHATKRIMRDFNVETRTAKSWLTGDVTPQLSSFMVAARLFGITAVLGVLFPETEEFEKSTLRDDLFALRSQLDALSEKLDMTKLGELDHDAAKKPEEKNLSRRRPPDR